MSRTLILQKNRRPLLYPITKLIQPSRSQMPMVTWQLLKSLRGLYSKRLYLWYSTCVKNSQAWHYVRFLVYMYVSYALNVLASSNVQTTLTCRRTCYNHIVLPLLFSFANTRVNLYIGHNIWIPLQTRVQATCTNL